jgi:hypothetical protein
LAEVAARLPDPRAQKFVTHRREAILTQAQGGPGEAQGPRGQFRGPGDSLCIPCLHIEFGKKPFPLLG